MGHTVEVLTSKIGGNETIFYRDIKQNIYFAVTPFLPRLEHESIDKLKNIVAQELSVTPIKTLPGILVRFLDDHLIFWGIGQVTVYAYENSATWHYSQEPGDFFYLGHRFVGNLPYYWQEETKVTVQSFRIRSIIHPYSAELESALQLHDRVHRAHARTIMHRIIEGEPYSALQGLLTKLEEVQ